MTSSQNETKKKMKKSTKILLSVVCSFTAVVLAVAITAVAVWYSGKANMTEKDVVITNSDTTVNEEDDTVEYNGVRYKYNKNISTVLCMGIDNEKKQSGGAYVVGRAGQADAVYLIAVDTANGKTTVIGIPRDVITDVDLYAKSGSFIGTEKTQLCLAYAYGDGKQQSAENTAKSVSRLLYGMPVNLHFAVDDKSIAPLHNAVGPITVITNEDINNAFISFRKGEQIKLTGSNVFKYLQTRNSETVDASVLRLERQLDYLKKYTSAVIEKSKSDLLFPVKLYNKVVKNSVTNLDAAKVTYLATSVLKKKDDVSLQFIQIEGEQRLGEDGFAEFYPDEDKLLQLVMEVFYTKVNETPEQ